MARFVSSVEFANNNIPEFVLIGPSNAGKSTLINSLSKSKIAFTSKVPGKTRTPNFYDFEKFLLVDMPGYGYVKGSKSLKSFLNFTLDNYFSNRVGVVGAIHVCVSHGLSDKDLEVLNYLRNRFHNYILLINKIDKLNNSEKYHLMSSIIKTTSLDESSIFFISARDMKNIDSVMKKLQDWI